MRILAFILVSSLVGCSSRLNLDSQLQIDTQYLVLKLERADLYFKKEDVLSEAQMDEARNSVQGNKEKYDRMLASVQNSNFDTLSFPIRAHIKSDEVRSNAHVFLLLSYVKLLTEKKTLVFNKTKQAFESRVICKRIKSKAGTQLSFRFQNGDEFLNEVISIRD